MTIRFRFTSITSSGGDVVTLPTSGVTCIVGGNNVGKSQLLRELWRLTDEPEADQQPLTISSLTVERPSGTVEETEQWLQDHAISYDMEPGIGSRYAHQMGGVPKSAVEVQGWFGSDHSGPAYLGNISTMFVHYARAGSLADYASGYIEQGRDENASLTRVLNDGELEEELSKLIQDTFGMGLVLDRVDSQMRFRVGSIAVPIPPINRPTKEYARAIAALPTLDSQGDGLRSFVGLALELLAARPDVLLVDEPEAFLHPGQARAAGRWLAKLASSSDVQVILATHDRDVVLGLLQGGAGVPLSVVRVSREGDSTRFAHLAADDVQAVWDNPVLRYSNVLQGLFHQKVVICESDGDCRFFGAALEEAAAQRDKRALADDILFVPSGSKNRVGSIADALAQLRVDALAIVDFDALRNKADIKGIVTGLGATWTPTMDSNYRKLADAANGRQLWDIWKNSGLSAVPAGATYSACSALLDELAISGVRVIRQGEMEDLDKNINLHGPAWVSEALEREVHKSPEVADFIGPILD